VSDQVIIRVPATTPHVGLVRAAASALSALQDFTWDRITDLHIAIDEACSRVMATAADVPGRIEVTFAVGEGELIVSVTGDRPMKSGATVLNVWSETILGSLAEDVQVDQRDGAARISFRVTRGARG
jgi:serine/threonine-protein kinase RsbW